MHTMSFLFIFQWCWFMKIYKWLWILDEKYKHSRNQGECSGESKCEKLQSIKSFHYIFIHSILSFFFFFFLCGVIFFGASSILLCCSPVARAQMGIYDGNKNVTFCFVVQKTYFVFQAVFLKISLFFFFYIFLFKKQMESQIRLDEREITGIRWGFFMQSVSSPSVHRTPLKFYRSVSQRKGTVCFKFIFIRMHRDAN